MNIPAEGGAMFYPETKINKEMDIKKRTSMRYEYKGVIYKIMFIAKMKIGQVWLRCVIYQSYKDKRIYVREHGDFFEKFIPAKDDKK
jgi:hypothetical protein